MSEFAENFSSGGVTPVYNAGVLRVPRGVKKGEDYNVGAPVQIFADLLPDKDIVGGQVDEGFVGDAGLPLKRGATQGVYEAADLTAEPAEEVAGLLLLATDAYDGPRTINVVKGGTVFANRGALKDLDPEAVAEALGGSYDPFHETIKF